MPHSYPSPSDLILWPGCFKQGSFQEVATAAVRLGYPAVAFNTNCYERWCLAERLTPADIRGIADRHGLRIPILELLREWNPERKAVERVEGVPVTAAEFFDLARTLGATVVTCADNGRRPLAPGVTASAFRDLCRQAADHGLSMAIEFVPFTGIPTVTAAWEVIQEAGEPNGAILFDSWHHQRGGGIDDSLRAVPGDRILGVQIVDIPRQAPEDWMSECYVGRRLPGDGELDLVSQVRTLREIGCRAPFGLEVFNPTLTAMDVAGVADAFDERTRRLIALAG